MNRLESQQEIKKKLDLETNTDEFVVGDKVLLKRTWGPHAKMSVRWKEDSKGNPYTITKTIGPVNYVISDSKGTTKIYHRNLLRHANIRIEPSFRNRSSELNNPSGLPSYTPVTRTPTTAMQTNPGTNRRIDNIQFTDNVFRNNSTAGLLSSTSSSSSPPSQHPQPPTLHHPTRVVNAIERLGIDNRNNGYTN